MFIHALAVGNPQLQGRAGIEVPDLDRVDTVPVRRIPGLEQVVDRRRTRPAAGLFAILERARIPAPFGMRTHPQGKDHVLGGELANARSGSSSPAPRTDRKRTRL